MSIKDSRQPSPAELYTDYSAAGRLGTAGFSLIEIIEQWPSVPEDEDDR